MTSMYRQGGKRALDLAIASTMLLILAPVIGILAIIIRFRLGSPILFTQPRPGKDGRIFVLLKFRSMTDATDEAGDLMPDSVRLTPTGKWLRAASLDELPQLWNVIRGEMSLIGPRPLLVEYLARYNSDQARRHEVLPGITGWAQVNGRNAISWEEKFDLDVYYVDNMSLVFDLKVLWLTLLRVFQRSGISQAEHATMPRFLGSESLDKDES